MRPQIMFCTSLAMLTAVEAGAGGIELEKVQSAMGIDKLKPHTVCVISGQSRLMGADGHFTITFDRERRFVEDVTGPILQ